MWGGWGTKDLNLCYCYLNNLKISSLAENTSTKVVFNEVLAMAGRDLVTKDISRLRGGWSMQDAFYVSKIGFSARTLHYMHYFFNLL